MYATQGSREMKKIPIIIDTDPGIDDVMMLVLAFTRPELDIRLITTASGNLTQQKTSYNALAFLSYIGADVEVAKGLEVPMFRELEVAEDIHGADGLGKVSFPAPTLALSERTAIQAMVDVLLASDEPITIVATGPLTNIAALLFAHPEVKPKIKEISWMGGAAVGGNLSPTAEFNAFVDPHAASFVFRAGVPIIMSGLDVTHKAYMTLDEAKAIATMPGEFAQKMSAMVTFYVGVMEATPFHAPNYENEIRFHDTCAISYLVTPELFEGEDYYVEVEMTSPLTAGTTIVDYAKRSGKTPNAKVLHNVKRQAFIEQFIDAVATMNARLNS